MSLTPSTMLPLGTKAPDFTLLDTISNSQQSLSDLQGSAATVVMFICNHCPYVLHLEDGIIQLAHDYAAKGVKLIAISSNDVETYPQDAPDKMHDQAIAKSYPFPYLFDESQAVAKAYMAACTPDIYLFDNNLACVYRGRFDESMPGNNKPVTGQDLRAALDAVLAGEMPSTTQIPSQGCNIKWRD